MAIEDRSIASTDLTRVIKDDDLGVEGCSLLGGIILGVRSDVTAADVLDRHVPEHENEYLHHLADSEDPLHVETDVVARNTLFKLLVVHFDGLDFSSDVRRSECNNHSGLDDTSLDTADGDSADTTDFVNILKGKTEWLVGGSNWGLDGVDGVEEGLAFDGTTLDLLGPTLVPWHATTVGESCVLSQ
jgi:hypothetical protein